jgi:hypothetical protein
MQQGNHRWILGGCTYDRPEENGIEDATWEALNAWDNFEPLLGKPKSHERIKIWKK